MIMKEFINLIKNEFKSINLKDYELEGCEITEDDFEIMAESLKNQNKSVRDIIHEYLLEIRQILDDGLDDMLDDID